MDELLQQVSDQTGVPVDMLERAARARADAEGASPEAVVARWVGAEVPAARSIPAPAVAPPIESAVPEAEALAVSVEILEPEVEPPELEPKPGLEPVPVGPGLPRWLSAAFVVVPFVALLYALVAPNGPDCGNAGRLAIDPVTGEAVNCDGSAFGATEVDFFATGELLYAANCESCHGATGGGGAGPALAGGVVLDTFSRCTDHIEWVSLGSTEWISSTYGDQPKNLSGAVMPGFGASLSVEDLASVVLFERVAFGLEEIAVAETGCGLIPPEVALGS